MREMTINDNDREDFVRNEEGLYRMWRAEMRGEKKLREFVRNNRNIIDQAIRAASRKGKTEDEPNYMIGRGAVGPGTSPRTNRYGQSMVGRAGQSLMPR